MPIQIHKTIELSLKLNMGHSPNRLEQQPVKLKVPGSSPGCPARGLLFVSFIRPHKTTKLSRN